MSLALKQGPPLLQPPETPMGRTCRGWALTRLAWRNNKLRLVRDIIHSELFKSRIVWSGVRCVIAAGSESGTSSAIAKIAASPLSDKRVAAVLRSPGRPAHGWRFSRRGGVLGL